MQILCPHCPPSPDDPALIAISDTSETVICDRCSRRYVTTTFRLMAISSKRRGEGRYRYALRTEEPSGAQRLRKFEAQGGIRLIPGTTVTLVRRGARLIGIADQNSNTWFWLDPNSNVAPHPKLDRYLRMTGWLIVALAALQMTRFYPEVAHVIETNPSGFLLAVLLTALIASLPALLWALQTHFGPSGGRRKTLPELAVGLDEDPAAAVAPAAAPIAVTPAPDRPPAAAPPAGATASTPPPGPEPPAAEPDDRPVFD